MTDFLYKTLYDIEKFRPKAFEYYSNKSHGLIDKYIDLMKSDFGEEHYILLSALSNYFNFYKILDIGTYKGLSALALSYNKTNKVITYDIEDCYQVDFPSNVEYRLCKNPENIFDIPDLYETKMILLDIDPHDGIQEQRFYEYLMDSRYDGILVLDDIHLNDGMKKFWNNIEHEKFDLTEIGHWSGTGLVNMTNNTLGKLNGREV